jgi:DNA recombination protein RmuC
MFLPSEQAVEKIVEADKNFLYKAWQANIFPVGPAGLMNMLSLAKFQISEQKAMEHHLEIMEEVKNLLNSVSIMSEYASKLGNNIANTVGYYDKFAASFNRNFLSKMHKINRLGIGKKIDKEENMLKRLEIFSSKTDLIELPKEEKRKIN